MKKMILTTAMGLLMFNSAFAQIETIDTTVTSESPIVCKVSYQPYTLVDSLDNPGTKIDRPMEIPQNQQWGTVHSHSLDLGGKRFYVGGYRGTGNDAGVISLSSFIGDIVKTADGKVDILDKAHVRDADIADKKGAQFELDLPVEDGLDIRLMCKVK